MSSAPTTIRSSELSRNSRKVFEAADRAPVLITRRDGEPLVLARAQHATRDHKGVEVAASVVDAALNNDGTSFTARLHRPFPWLALLTESDQATFADEILAMTRACAAIADFARLLTTLESWKATAEAVAAGYTPDDQLDWYDTPVPVTDPRA